MRIKGAMTIEVDLREVLQIEVIKLEVHEKRAFGISKLQQTHSTELGRASC